MDDLKKYTQEQLIYRAKNYLDRLNSLMNNISEYIEGKKTKEKEIKAEYADLKTKINEEYKYFSSNKNDIMDKSPIHRCYQSGIMDASAKGFSSRVGANINQKLYSDVEEAEYELNYYMKDCIK